MEKKYQCPKCGCEMVIKVASKKAKALPDAIGSQYKAGASGLQLMAKYKTSWAMIREKLVSLGVKIRPKGLPPNDTLNGSRKINANARKEIAALHMRGINHEEIGRRYDISAERVRQIIAILKLPARSTIVQKGIAQKIKAKVETDAEKAQMRRAKLEAASELWKQGENWKVIADLMNWKCTSPQGFYSHLGSLRRTGRRSMFPPRKPNHWKLKNPP